MTVPQEIISFAERWAWWEAKKREAPDHWELIPAGPPPLLDHEREALILWVRREMQAEFDRRHTQDYDGPRWAVYIGDMLGIRSDDNAGDLVPGSWALCEAAGWPSWAKA